MRFILLMAALASVALTAACDKEGSSLPPVKPTDIISERDAEKASNGDVEFVLKHNAVMDCDDNTYIASYLPEKLGEGDPIIVEVVYPDESISAGEIKRIFDDGYNKRFKKRKIEGIGEQAYVAFPTLNIFEEGHLIKITAGSGDTQQQLDLLLVLGQRAVKNLNSYLFGNGQ